MQGFSRKFTMDGSLQSPPTRTRNVYVANETGVLQQHDSNSPGPAASRTSQGVPHCRRRFGVGAEEPPPPPPPSYSAHVLATTGLPVCGVEDDGNSWRMGERSHLISRPNDAAVGAVVGVPPPSPPPSYGAHIQQSAAAAEAAGDAPPKSCKVRGRESVRAE